jgi:hypothetical protein
LAAFAEIAFVGQIAIANNQHAGRLGVFPASDGVLKVREFQLPFGARGTAGQCAGRYESKEPRVHCDRLASTLDVVSIFMLSIMLVTNA